MKSLMSITAKQTKTALIPLPTARDCDRFICELRRLEGGFIVAIITGLAAWAGYGGGLAYLNATLWVAGILFLAIAIESRSQAALWLHLGLGTVIMGLALLGQFAPIFAVLGSSVLALRFSAFVLQRTR